MSGTENIFELHNYTLLEKKKHFRCNANIFMYFGNLCTKKQILIQNIYYKYYSIFQISPFLYAIITLKNSEFLFRIYTFNILNIIKEAYTTSYFIKPSQGSFVQPLSSQRMYFDGTDITESQIKNLLKIKLLFFSLIKSTQVLQTSWGGTGSIA